MKNIAKIRKSKYWNKNRWKLALKCSPHKNQKPKRDELIHLMDQKVSALCGLLLLLSLLLSALKMDLQRCESWSVHAQRHKHRAVNYSIEIQMHFREILPKPKESHCIELKAKRIAITLNVALPMCSYARARARDVCKVQIYSEKWIAYKNTESVLNVNVIFPRRECGAKHWNEIDFIARRAFNLKSNELSSLDIFFYFSLSRCIAFATLVDNGIFNVTQTIDCN